MQQTSKYQFNLVEGSDDFSPTPLNQNMEKVEALLADLGAEAAEKGFVIGSYTGNGGTLSVNLGFKPRFLHITGTICNSYIYRSTYQHEVATGGAQAVEVVQLTDTGFTVVLALDEDGSEELYPMVNRSGDTYSYIAFR